MVKVGQQLAPSQTSVFRIKLQRYRKLNFFRKETKQVESKKKNTCSKRTSVFLDGSQALIYILLLIKVFHHSFIHPPLCLAHPFNHTAVCFSRGSAGRLFSSGRRCTTDPCAPLRTLCGTFWPPRDPSCRH